MQSTHKDRGPFTLVDDTGAQVTDAALKGRPTVMYFGFTFCPEICPTTLTELAQWMQLLGPDADKLNYVFVTVDPQRDTPQGDARLRVCLRPPHPRPYRNSRSDR